MEVEDSFWTLLRKFRHISIGSGNGGHLLRAHEDALVLSSRHHNPDQSSTDQDEVLCLNFCSSLPPGMETAQDPPPHSQLVTIKDKMGRYLTALGTQVFFHAMTQPSVDNFFYLILHYLPDGSVRIQSSTEGYFLSVNKERFVTTQRTASPAGTFHFHFKCSIKNRFTRLYLGVESDNDYVVARHPQLCSPAQVFLIRLGQECEIYSAVKDSRWAVQEDVILSSSPSWAEPLMLRLSLVDGGSFYLRHAKEPIKMLRVSEDGHLYCQPQPDYNEINLFEISCYPPSGHSSPATPSQSPAVSLIDLSHDHIDSMYNQAVGSGSNRPFPQSGSPSLGMHHQAQKGTLRRSQDSPVMTHSFSSTHTSSKRRRFSFRLCDTAGKLDKLYHITQELSGKKSQTLVLCSDSFFSQKIRDTLRDNCGCFALSVGGSSPTEGLVNNCRSVKNGETRYLVSTFELADTLSTYLGSLDLFGSIIYFDVHDSAQFYARMETRVQPEQIYMIVCPADHPIFSTLFNYLDSSQSLLTDASEIEALRRMQKTHRQIIFNSALDSPNILRCAQEWVAYLTKWVKFYSTRSVALTEYDKEALKDRIERQECLHLQPDGSDADSLLQIVIYFLQKIPSHLLTNYFCHQVSNILHGRPTGTNLQYRIKQEISQLPQGNNQLADNFFRYLHRVRAAQLATARELAVRFSPVLIGNSSPENVEMLSLLIREYGSISNASFGDLNQIKVSQDKPPEKHSAPLLQLNHNPSRPPQRLYSQNQMPSSGQLASTVSQTPAALLGFPPPQQQQAVGWDAPSPRQAFPNYPPPMPSQQAHPEQPMYPQQYNPVTLTGHQPEMNAFPHPVTPPRRREDWELDLREIQYHKKIGVGSFGEVWRGEWAGIDVAIKKVNKVNIGPKEVAAFREEIDIMAKLRHPNILQFFGACLEPELCLVTAFAERASLFHALQDRSLTWDHAKKIMLGVARGMHYLHTRTPPIVHRDIKSLNILVTSDWKGIVADFGLTTIKDQQFLKTYCGSPAWTAPEVLRGLEYDESADVFSFGVVLWEILTRKPPYEGMSPNVIIGRVIPPNGMRPPIPDASPSEFVRLMTHCWDDVPSRRPTFAQIIEHLRRIFSM